MTKPIQRTVGPFAIRDSGPPPHADAYTTVVVFHGFSWHGGVFTRFLPLAANHKARVVLVNRRDYPGSSSFSEEDRHLLESNISSFMKARTEEIYQFLCKFSSDEHIAPQSLIIAGWSFGATFVLALLAYASSFPLDDTSGPLTKYIRRAVLYDPPYHALGYPPPSDFYNPLTHLSLPPGEGARIFPAWVSGYYSHGNSAQELEHRIALEAPKPTILTMSHDDIQAALHTPPAIPGGSDDVLMHVGINHGLWDAIRRKALSVDSTLPSSDWNKVELRYVWCDHSVWEMPWGTWALQDELAQAAENREPLRSISLMRLTGANHFAHWDQPDRALAALLSDSIEEHRYRF